MTWTILNGPLLTSVQGLTSSLRLNWAGRSILSLLTRKSKRNLKNLNEQKNNTVRTCSKCGETKPLTKDYYQPVKAFKYNFSYYCNDCNRPKTKE